MKDLFHKFRATLVFRDRINGGIPKSKDLIRKWQEAIGGTPDQAEKTIEEMGNELEEKIESCWNGFKSDPKIGLYVEARQVKAMLKESANVTGVTTKIKGARNFITNGIFIKPYKIPLGVTKPTEFEESVCHISGPTGKRSAINRTDYVQEPTLQIEVWVLNRFDEKDVVPDEVLRMLFDHGQESGLGARRSQGFGQFDLTEWEAIDE